MENEKPKKLYPLHFGPVVEEMPWGTQTWALADLGFVNSEIKGGWLDGNSMEDLMETYIDRAVGEACYQYYGRQFPVAVRYMDIQGETPLLVHPDDEEAMHRYDALGKAQLVYIAEAAADARLYLGFERELSAQELYARCIDGSIMETLHEITPAAGEYYMVKPGLVNAFKGKLKLVVIQESSAVDLVLHDPNPSEEDEELQLTHLAEAIDLIDYRPYAQAIADPTDPSAAGTQSSAPVAEKSVSDSTAEAHSSDAATEAQSSDAAAEKSASEETAEKQAEKKPTDQSTELLVSRPEFTVSRISLKDPLQMSLEHLGCFLVYTCVEGAASIQIPTVNDRNEKCMENYEFKAGETILVPAEIPGFFLVPRDRDTILLETIVESHDDIDDYIDPNTEPFLEGEDYEGLEDGDFDEEDDCCCGDHDCHCDHHHEDDHECHCHSDKPQN